MVDDVLRIHRHLADVRPHLVGFLEPGEDIDFVGEGRRHAEGEPVGVLDGRSSDGSLLGGNEDDTVLRAHTVDGSRSVLEHRNALDIFRVELGEHGRAAVGVRGVVLLASAGRGPYEAVDDDQGLVVAAELEVGVEVTGISGPLADEESRDLSLQRREDVALFCRGELLAPDVGDGARK